MPVAPRSPALQDCGLGRHLLSRCPPPSALPSPPLGHRGAGRAHLSPVAPRQEQRRPPGPGESCLPPLEGLPGTGGSRVSRGSRGSRGRAEASGPQPRPMAPARPDPSPGTASQAAARPVCPWGQRRSPWTRSSPEPGPHPQARGCFPGSKRPGGVNESHWEATAAALSHPGDDDTRRPPAADSQGGGDTAPPPGRRPQCPDKPGALALPPSHRPQSQTGCRSSAPPAPQAFGPLVAGSVGRCQPPAAPSVPSPALSADACGRSPGGTVTVTVPTTPQCTALGFGHFSRKRAKERGSARPPPGKACRERERHKPVTPAWSQGPRVPEQLSLRGG